MYVASNLSSSRLSMVENRIADCLFQTVLTARDAWIQADANRFGGANFCTLWRAFASRGLGVNAANHRDDSTVPAGC